MQAVPPAARGQRRHVAPLPLVAAAWFTRLVSPSRRRVVVSILAAFVFGLVVPIVAGTLEWYFETGRHWWGLVLFIATYCLPYLAGYVFLFPVLRPFRERRRARRSSRSIADHAAR
jgi:MFS family permease